MTMNYYFFILQSTKKLYINTAFELLYPFSKKNTFKNIYKCLNVFILFRKKSLYFFILLVLLLLVLLLDVLLHDFAPLLDVLLPLRGVVLLLHDVVPLLLVVVFLILVLVLRSS